MRVVSALLLALLIVAPSSAQTHLADGEGLYVGVRDVQVRTEDGKLAGFGVSGELGRRFASGLDVGLVGSLGRYGFDSSTTDGAAWSLGGKVGLTRPAPFGTFTRLEALATVSNSRSAFLVEGSPESYRYGRVGADLEALVGRTVPVVGSVAFQPAVGAYAAAWRATSIETSDHFDALNPREGAVEAGLAFELPVRFRVFGTDAAVVPAGRLSVLNPYDLVTPQTGVTLRVNF